MFCIELQRSFRNKKIMYCMFLGCVIAIIHVFHNMVGKISYINASELFAENSYLFPDIVFDEWICGNTYNIEGFIYFMIFPIIISIPYAGSFYEDMKSGLVKHIYIKCDRWKYLASKFIAVFISAGTVFVVPLILNLAICSTIFPSLKPQLLAAKTLINSSVLWFDIYEKYPYLYILLFFVLDFIFAGLIASLSLTAVFFTERKFVVLLTPFIQHVFSYSICMMSGQPNAVMCAPTYFLFSGAGCMSEYLVIIYGGIYMLFIMLYFILGVKVDCY